MATSEACSPDLTCSPKFIDAPNPVGVKSKFLICRVYGTTGKGVVIRPEILNPNTNTGISES
jgi:hypothetical protein